MSATNDLSALLEVIGVKMKDIYDRTAINKTAALVVGAGTHYTPNKKVQTNDSDLPIETRAITKSELCQPCFIDLTGSRIGRLTVIGAAREFKGSWVLRCDCGTYTTRKSKAIKNTENIQDRCEHCRHLAFLKRNEQWRRTGRCSDIRDF